MGGFIIFQSVLLWWYYNDKKAYRILAVLPTIQDVGHLAVMRAAMEPGVHAMSDELILQISCNIFLAFKWILTMTSGQNISYYTIAKLSVHVWNHDLIWWQNKIDTQKHFRKTTITSSWTLRKTKIPITIVKAQMPSNPNQKSRTRDNNITGAPLCICLRSFHRFLFLNCMNVGLLPWFLLYSYRFIIWYSWQALSTSQLLN